MTEFEIHPGALTGHMAQQTPSKTNSVYHHHQSSPTDSLNTMPPPPLPEEEAAVSRADNDDSGEFDLSDEQADQLLRELDLLGAQLQLMDHETQMLGAKSGNNANTGSSGTYRRVSIGSNSASGKGSTPYRVKLHADEETPISEEREDDDDETVTGEENMTKGSEMVNKTDKDGSNSNHKQRRRHRARRARSLFVPRKPTTAEALQALEPRLNPQLNDVAPLELVPDATPASPLSPKHWIRSMSNLLRGGNDNSDSESLSSSLDAFASSTKTNRLGRSQTVHARERPRSMMQFGASWRTGSAVPPDHTAIPEDAGLRRSNTVFSGRATSVSINESTSSSDGNASVTPTEASKPKRRQRPYSMGFFGQQHNAQSHDAEADAALLQRLEQLNQELNADPKTVRMCGNSIQAGTATLKSLATGSSLSRESRRRTIGSDFISTLNRNESSGGSGVSAVVLDDSDAVRQSRRRSAFAFA